MGFFNRLLTGQNCHSPAWQVCNSQRHAHPPTIGGKCRHHRKIPDARRKPRAQSTRRLRVPHKSNSEPSRSSALCSQFPGPLPTNWRQRERSNARDFANGETCAAACSSTSIAFAHTSRVARRRRRERAGRQKKCRPRGSGRRQLWQARERFHSITRSASSGKPADGAHQIMDARRTDRPRAFPLRCPRGKPKPLARDRPRDAGRNRADPVPGRKYRREQAMSGTDGRRGHEKAPTWHQAQKAPIWREFEKSTRMAP